MTAAAWLALALAAAPPATVRLSFDAAVRRGLAHNVDAQVAAQEIARAEALLGVARGGALPHLTGIAEYIRLDNDRRSAGHLVAGRDQAQAWLGLSVPLAAPSTWGAVAHADTQVEVAATAQLAVHRQVALAVGRAYLAVMSRQRLTEAIANAVTTARAHFDFAHARLSGGVGNRLDELLAGQELANSEVLLAQAADADNQAREALGVLLGADGPCEVDLDLALPAAPPPGSPEPAGLDARQDVRLAGARLLAARQVARDGYLDYLPSLTANGNAFFQTPPTISSPRFGWQIMLLLNISFYDGGARESQHAQARAVRAEAEAQLADLQRSARSEVRVAFESVHLAERALAAATEAADRAHASIRLSTDAYRAGSSNNLVVVDAERRGRDADIAAIVAEDGVRQARLNLLTAAGRFP